MGMDKCGDCQWKNPRIAIIRLFLKLKGATNTNRFEN